MSRRPSWRQRGEFEPILDFDINRADADQPVLAEDAQFFDQPQTDVNSLLNILVPNRRGGQFEFTNQTMLQNLLQNETINTPTIRYTQSLLQGAGFNANVALIRAAELNTEAAIEQLRFTAVETVAQTEIAFWELWFQQQNLRAFAWVIERVKEQVCYFRNRLGDGDGRAELLRAVSGLRILEFAFQQQLEDMQIAERDLKQLVLLPDAPVDSTAYFDLTTTYHHVPEIAPSLDRDFLRHIGLSHRNDLKEFNFQIDALGQELLRARNDRLPMADVFVEGNFISEQGVVVNGLATPDRNINQLNFGLQSNVPLFGNRVARAQIRELFHQRLAAIVARDELAIAIVKAINDAADQLQRSHKRVQIAEDSVNVAFWTYREEWKRVNQGFSRGSDLLFVITQAVGNELANYYQAVRDYRFAEANLLFALGTLLENRHLLWCNIN